MTKYPLAQLVLIKQKRLEEAERELAKRREELAEEERKLEKAKKVLQEVLDHKQEKLNLLRAELDAGTTTDKVEQAKIYLDTVEEKRIDKDAKVKKQQLAVEEAEKAVDEGRKTVFNGQADVEKLNIHQEEWQKEQHLLEKQEEDKQTEETGTAMFIRKKRMKGG